MTEALPVGTRLLHVGPHKTGTTALQSAFHRNRDQLRDHGVHYAGATQQPMAAALAAANMTTRRNGGQAMQPWLDLVAEVRRSTADRVVISSEFFANAGPKVAELIADDLGRDGLQVVITLRPLAKIFPSQWQQYVQNGLAVPYDEWLHAMLDEPPFRLPTPTFWRRHRHDRLVGRWVRAVGAQNVTVIVVDDADRTALLRTFERLVDVPTGSLVAADDRSNRSMTIAETRVLLELNALFADAGLPDEVYQRAVRFGAARYLTRAPRDVDDPPISTPAWALARVDEIAQTMIRRIRRSGVAVIGSLDQLATSVPARSDLDEMTTAPIRADLAARTAMGVVLALSSSDPSRETRDDVTLRQRAAVIARRTGNQVRHAFGRRPRG